MEVVWRLQLLLLLLLVEYSAAQPAADWATSSAFPDDLAEFASVTSSRDDERIVDLCLRVSCSIYARDMPLHIHGPATAAGPVSSNAAASLSLTLKLLTALLPHFPI